MSTSNRANQTIRVGDEIEDGRHWGEVKELCGSKVRYLDLEDFTERWARAVDCTWLPPREYRYTMQENIRHEWPARERARRCVYDFNPVEAAEVVAADIELQPSWSV